MNRRVADRSGVGPVPRQVRRQNAADIPGWTDPAEAAAPAARMRFTDEALPIATTDLFQVVARQQPGLPSSIRRGPRRVYSERIVIYGLYLSAAGVVANSYRIDVLSNNLANSETVGFKRDLAEFQQRPTERQERGGGATNWSDPILEGMGGGLLLHPTMVDNSPGQFEQTGSPLDMAINGSGYFAVKSNGQQFLTRDGRMIIRNDGTLIRAANGEPVLDPNGNPITLSNTPNTSVNNQGIITQDGKPVARVGVFDVADNSKLKKEGSGLLDYSDAGGLNAGAGEVRSEFVEHSNVDPTTELTDLMEAERQLEASANMIRYQDQSMQELVDQVGKIS